MGTQTTHDEKLVHTLMTGAVDFHSHGVGRFDFSEIPSLALHEIENTLAAKQHRAILTLYLPKDNFDSFLALMDVFHLGKTNGLYPHIAGIALEGPLLSSPGGTPKTGVWMPTKRQWLSLAACGKKGLVYSVLSPDAEFPAKVDSTNLDIPPNDITWVAETLLQGGVLPAAGHFKKSDPLKSAQQLQLIFDVVAAWGQGSTITDHLWNDMPLNFKHAWRTPTAKQERAIDIHRLTQSHWTLNNMDDMLGPVPATMIRNARKGLVKLCQNFDGEHVDLYVISKAAPLIGTENMLMMTDSIESMTLGGRRLHTEAGSSLLYQDEGIVACGSKNVKDQICNMLDIGFSAQDIRLITQTTPNQLLRYEQTTSRHNKKDQAVCI